MPRAPRLAVVLLNRQRRRRVDPVRLRRALRGAALRLDVAGELALLLTGDEPVRRLNSRYRGQDKATDVLSFPGACAGHRASPARRARCAACARGEPELGDVVISVEAAARNARALGRTLPQELDVLALHGFLHVLGYDHETDDGTMDRLERRLRRTVLNKRAANSLRRERMGGSAKRAGGAARAMPHPDSTRSAANSFRRERDPRGTGE